MLHDLPLRRVAVLGGTGSVGRATIDVLRHLDQVDSRQRWQALAVSGHQNLDELFRLAGQCPSPPEILIASDPATRDEAEKHFRKNQLTQSLDSCRLDVGPEALVRAAEHPEVDTVVAGIMGRAGLESTLAAVRAGKRVGLANKETLVIAGPVVMRAAQVAGAELLPVDSEHSAIHQCLAESRFYQSHPNGTDNHIPDRSVSGLETAPAGDDSNSRPGQLPAQQWPHVRKIILTASGGPFRDWTPEQMDDATPQQALAHPTWSMGDKISIDSASMMNKALEVIEAKWLFGVSADQIDVVVHPQSLIHSMVEFDDGSVIAQVSPPDMKLPIQYALTAPRRLPSSCPPLRRDSVWDMSLLPADVERFPALALGFEVARVGGTAGVVVNGANETAVDLFLRGQIRFTDIARLCRQILLDHHHESSPNLETLLKLDRWSRRRADELAAAWS